MLKKFHGVLLGISSLSILAVLPAMADGLTWWHPDDIESYTVINGDVNSVLNGGTYNIITGTGMRNIVNGNVTLTLNGVTQEVVGKETNVFGILFLPSTSNYLSLEQLTGVAPTEEQAAMQMFVNGDVTLNVYNSTIGQSVVGVNFYADTDELTNSGLSGKITVNVDNSTVDYSVRGVNYRDVATTVDAAHVGDIEINVNDSLIKEEIVSAGSAASAGNVVINVTGDTVIGYTDRDLTDTSGDGWIIAGANRKTATIASTEINLNTAGTINIAGDVNVGSRDRHDDPNAPDTDEDSVIGDATLSMLGGGTVNIGGDLRAYHVGGKTTLNIGDIVANIDGNVANEFQEINMSENATLNVGGTFAMTSDGVLNMTLLSPDSYSQIVANSIDANGAALNFTVSHEGVYEVLGFDELVSDFAWNKENALYNLLHEDGTGTITAELKSVEDIAADNNLTNEAAHTVAMFAESSSDQLNNLAISVQNYLADGNTDVVEQAHKAIHPETESVAQSVTTSLQSTLANLAAGRMTMIQSLRGRSGGDAAARSGVWVEGLYNKSKQNDAFNGYTRGIVAGIDTIAARSLMLGVGYSYAHSDVSGTAHNTEIDSNTIFLYGQYKPTAWYMNAMLNYTMSDYTEKSDVLGVAVKSDYDVDALGAQVMTGYDFAGGITPEVGLRYMHISTDEYKNSLGVKNKLDNSDYLTAVLGTKYAFDYRVARGFTLRPELRYAVKYDLVSDKSVATVTMPGVPSYVLDGNRLSRIGAEFGGGLVMKYQDFSLSLNYDIEVREGYTSQTGRVRARMVF